MSFHLTPPSASTAFPLLAVLATAGCLAPRPAEDGPEGSVDEFGEMIVRQGARPVQGSEGPGTEDEPQGDPYALPDLDTAKAMQEALDAAPRAPELPEPPELSPYIRFGEKILLRTLADGSQMITKPYPMPPGKALKLAELIAAMEPFVFLPRGGIDPETGSPPPPVSGAVNYEILESWDQEFYGDLDAENPAGANAVQLSDLIVVTADSEMLAEFEYFVDTFSAGVPQIELEAKIIEIVDSDTRDIGFGPLVGTGAPPVFGFQDSTFVKSLDLNFRNVTDPFEALLTLGAVQDGVAFNAVLEAVQIWQNVSIDSRPKTVVRAGGVAKLESTIEIPFFEVNSITPLGGFNATVEYKKVGVKLYISPRVVGSKMLSLDVQLEGSQAVGSQQVVSSTSQGSGGQAGTTTGVDVPVIATRTARTVVYLEPGQTLVIGGLTQERSQDVVNKIPVLGDIPILGHLFRSTFQQVEKEHVIFAISPRIVQSSELQPEL